MSGTNRREFLKRAGAMASGMALGAGALAGCAREKASQVEITTTAAPSPSSGPTAPATGSAKLLEGLKNDLAVARGSSDPAALVRAAVEALGGMSAIVAAGQTVCLKPNASWDRVPGSGANTHPDVLAETAKMCFEAGAKRVIAVDYTLASDPLGWNGLRDACEAAGGTFIELTKDSQSLFEPMTYVDGMKVLPEILDEEKVSIDLLNADVVINMPVLKTHSATGLSIAVKNLMGVSYYRGQYHAGGGGGYASGQAGGSGGILDQAIADLGLLLRDKITLTIVDCTYILRHGSGPRGLDDIDGEPMMHCIAGTDMVACDQKAAQLFGMSDEEIRTKVPHIHLSESTGVGSADLTKFRVAEVDLGAETANA